MMHGQKNIKKHRFYFDNYPRDVMTDSHNFNALIHG